MPNDFLTTLQGFRTTVAANLTTHQANLAAANATVAAEMPAVAEWTDFLAVVDAEIAKYAPPAPPPTP